MSYSLLRDLLRRQDTTAQAIREVILDHILKACGLYGMVPPRGPIDVEDALLAEQEHQSERRRRAVFAASF
jgi:hypothetical protein